MPAAEGAAQNDAAMVHELHVPALSARELEVLLAWIRSDSKKEVCAQLYISTGTVNTHLARIRCKYELAGRVASTKAALLARALQDGYISLDEL
ncbi:LuxR C-terminal-related transcriptional regulator [Nocardia africana]|uniref:ATP-dependent transcriptional regulator n=1 Tax=Nocardia africana TaxID=134964 RepID=A0A378WUK2_9NOCA|nr:LuxR C-terminal-related transcriptional regulator [Nocardia africana]MCC3313684.1 LuxR C-terminal-related transcriptional regulator [Nocardia africana]SUA44936.1 ATP-dependent transcriptional regulator [Nocardia africana]